MAESLRRVVIAGMSQYNGYVHSSASSNVQSYWLMWRMTQKETTMYELLKAPSMVHMHKTYKQYTFLVLHVIAVSKTCLPLRILAASSQKRQDTIDRILDWHRP
jgi:hypothetical protein